MARSQIAGQAPGGTDGRRFSNVAERSCGLSGSVSPDGPTSAARLSERTAIPTPATVRPPGVGDYQPNVPSPHRRRARVLEPGPVLRVGRVIERVTARRVEFLAGTYRELAFPPPEARRRALLCDGAYVGHFQLRRAAPGIAPRGRALRSYAAAVLDLLVTGGETPGSR